MNEEPKAKITQFLEAYDLMRKYQKLYFKNRMIPDLQKAKQYESLCDKLRASMNEEVRPPDAVQDALL